MVGKHNQSFDHGDQTWNVSCFSSIGSRCWWWRLVEMLNGHDSPVIYYAVTESTKAHGTTKLESQKAVYDGAFTVNKRWVGRTSMERKRKDWRGKVNLEWVRLSHLKISRLTPTQIFFFLSLTTKGWFEWISWSFVYYLCLQDLFKK